MESILEELYSGNISPGTQYFSRQFEYGRAMKNLSDREDELLSALCDEASLSTDGVMVTPVNGARRFIGRKKYVGCWESDILMLKRYAWFPTI